MARRNEALLTRLNARFCGKRGRKLIAPFSFYASFTPQPQESRALTVAEWLYAKTDAYA
jgi:hypothetical protein